ncbi:MAG: ribonuclease H-like domain-containing protein, partial [Thermodesulfobacteriota bacterium]|nr:ribonuclease H-like domain-containing protein [Thermodesulfobacteriota bacterium]
MIRSTFSILDGIGKITERKLWNLGIRHWNEFLYRETVPGISPKRKHQYNKDLIIASSELEAKNSHYFLEKLKKDEHWKLFDVFKEQALFLDIETTGISSDSNDLTVVGLYDGRTMKALVQGVDLTEENLLFYFSNCKILVTFFGSAFDLPFIASKFPSIDLCIPHFDLCFAARKLGLTGGLKKIETLVGITR